MTILPCLTKKHQTWKHPLTVQKTVDWAATVKNSSFLPVLFQDSMDRLDDCMRGHMFGTLDDRLLFGLILWRRCHSNRLNCGWIACLSKILVQECNCPGCSTVHAIRRNSFTVCVGTVTAPGYVSHISKVPGWSVKSCKFSLCIWWAGRVLGRGRMGCQHLMLLVFQAKRQARHSFRSLHRGTDEEDIDCHFQGPLKWVQSTVNSCWWSET